MTLTETILQLAARDGGAMTADFIAAGYTQDAVNRATYALRHSGRLWGYKRSGGAEYHATEAAYNLAHAAWNAGAKERLRIRERLKYAKRKEEDPAWVAAKNARLAKAKAKKRAADREAGVLPPMTRRAPREYKVTPKQKPAFPATVTIKSSARGPAYLPGDPVITPHTIYTVWSPPYNSKIRTNTHAE